MYLSFVCQAYFCVLCHVHIDAKLVCEGQDVMRCTVDFNLVWFFFNRITDRYSTIYNNYP